MAIVVDELAAMSVADNHAIAIIVTAAQRAFGIGCHVQKSARVVDFGCGGLAANHFLQRGLHRVGRTGFTQQAGKIRSRVRAEVMRALLCS